MAKEALYQLVVKSCSQAYIWPRVGLWLKTMLSKPEMYSMEKKPKGLQMLGRLSYTALKEKLSVTESIKNDIGQLTHMNILGKINCLVEKRGWI